jgi:FkbM family methyltransferase
LPGMDNKMKNSLLSAFALCFLTLLLHAAPQGSLERHPKLVATDPKSGLELWDTRLGRLWIPAPGSDVIRHLEWEQTVQKVYEHPAVHVQRNDVVIDCGAHIGGFTRVALDAGARLVVAIEPEQANVTALKRNFEPEIKAGKVVLVPRGVWDKAGKLALHLSSVGDSHSVVIPQNKGADESIEVTTIDDLVAGLHLPRVDFIKMDIEGAEQKALEGARRTLLRYHPRLAVSAYHIKGDPSAICALVWRTCPDYLVGSKDVEEMHGVQVPKVLFFF